jgi:hypothetical protein
VHEPTLTIAQGMARMLSHSLTGRHIEGIWYPLFQPLNIWFLQKLTRRKRHTSVVVFGQEVCFGMGIERGTPGQMRYGAPIEIIDMGKTHIPLQVFTEYLETLKAIWTYVWVFAEL